MFTRAVVTGDSMQPWAVATVVSVTVLALISVALRMTARWMKKVPLGLDDYFILSSMVMFLVVMGFIMGMVHFGMGLHADTLEPNNVVMVAKFLLVAEILYVINLALTKLSLLVMYYRIFPVGNFKILAYAIGGFVIAWVITIVFVFIFICTPVKKMWYVDTPGHCVNQVATWCANAASTIASDIAILVLPMPRVWKLNISVVQRAWLGVAFGLGFFVVFASVYRFTVLFDYSALDSSWTLTNVVAWTAIEIAVGIISACLPTLRPILRLVVGRFSGSSHDPSKNGTNGANSRLGFTESGTNHLASSTGGGPFQRLDDTKLVPAHRTGNGSVAIAAIGSKNSLGEEDLEASSMEGDEIPLHKIRVRTDTAVKWGQADV